MSRSLFLARLLWRARLTEVARRALAKRGRWVLEFHGVSSCLHRELPLDAQPTLSADDLERILQWLSPRFRFLDPDEFLDTAQPGVLLTFDDGHANNVDVVLPVLERHQAPAVFFVTTQHVVDPSDWLPASRHAAARAGFSPERVPSDLAAELFDGLSREQLRTCAQSGNVTVGAHTVTHPLLTECDSDRLERELGDSRDLLQQAIGGSVDLLAYPCGDYDARVIAAVRRAGYLAAFAEESRSLGFGRFEIPRIGIYSSDPAYLAAKLSGLFRKPVGALAPL